MILRLYSDIFVEIQALFPEILRFEFVTLFVKTPCNSYVLLYMWIYLSIISIATYGVRISTATSPKQHERVIKFHLTI